MATLDLKDMATMLVNVSTAIPYAGILREKANNFFAFSEVASSTFFREMPFIPATFSAVSAT